MATAPSLIQLWSTHPYFDMATRRELLLLTAQEEALDDRFYRHLEFGTGGLRGLIGAGTNRINIYTVRQATQGLAAYISQHGEDAKQRGVVIAHDPRHLSSEFAREAALTLNANGITAYLWDRLRPTPMLSFAVRELKSIAGIVITASHNPPQYNGYKVYWEDGGQVPPERAAAIQTCIRDVEDITRVVPMPEHQAWSKNLLRAVPAKIDQTYYESLLSLVASPRKDREACRILYTALHGSGNVPVRQVLTDAGFQLSIVSQQEQPDADFPTVRYPNPEEREVFDLALKQAETGQPDLIMATDPDADRLGVMVRDGEGEYRLLTGNQIGAILVDFLLASKSLNGTLPPNGAVIKTIATSNLIAPLCRQHGVALFDTHTGFKFIGDLIREFEETESHTFLLGFEESYGYLGATFVRDKDAVMSALLVADAAAFHKARGRTLYDALNEIWQKAGYFLEDLHNVTLPGKDGQEQIRALMDQARQNPPTVLGGEAIAFTDDYAVGMGMDHRSGGRYPLQLGRANVIHYRFGDGGFVMVRPSGTEPKLKVYFSVVGGDLTSAQRKLVAVKYSTLSFLDLV